MLRLSVDVQSSSPVYEAGKKPRDRLHTLGPGVEGMLPNSGLTFGYVVLEDVEPFEDWLKRGAWNLIYISNRIWYALSASMWSCHDVTSPTLRADLDSLDGVQVAVGDMYTQ